jgi:hypothetical protein
MLCLFGCQSHLPRPSLSLCSFRSWALPCSAIAVRYDRKSQIVPALAGSKQVAHLEGMLDGYRRDGLRSLICIE